MSSKPASSQAQAPEQTPPPSEQASPDPNLTYPYRDKEGAPITRWWVRFKPLYTYAMQTRSNRAARRQEDGQFIVDEDTATFHLLTEMVEGYCLPDFAHPGEELPVPLTRAAFDTLPAYLVNFMDNEITKRSGADPTRWTVPIQGRDATFRGSAA